MTDGPGGQKGHDIERARRMDPGGGGESLVGGGSGRRWRQRGDNGRVGGIGLVCVATAGGTLGGPVTSSFVTKDDVATRSIGGGTQCGRWYTVCVAGTLSGGLVVGG